MVEITKTKKVPSAPQSQQIEARAELARIKEEYFRNQLDGEMMEEDGDEDLDGN